MSRKMVELNVDLYKPSGKWGYGFKVSIPMPHPGMYVQNHELLAEISERQTEITPEAVTGGNYIVVIKETPETMADPEYKGFLCRLIMNTN